MKNLPLRPPNNWTNFSIYPPHVVRFQNLDRTITPQKKSNQIERIKSALSVGPTNNYNLSQNLPPVEKPKLHTTHTVVGPKSQSNENAEKSNIYKIYLALYINLGPPLPRVHIPFVLQTITLHPYHVISYFLSLSHALLWTQKISLFFSYPTTFLWIQTLKKKNSKTLEFFSLIYSLLIATLRKLESPSFSPPSMVFQSGVYLFLLSFFVLQLVYCAAKIYDLDLIVVIWFRYVPFGLMGIWIWC